MRTTLRRERDARPHEGLGSAGACLALAQSIALPLAVLGGPLRASWGHPSKLLFYLAAQLCLLLVHK